jgi:hypothetical protein
LSIKIDSDGLAEYVRAVLKVIEKGIAEDETSDQSETFSLSGPIKFQVALTNISEKKGEVKLFVMGLVDAGASGRKTNQEDARVEFEVTDSLTSFFRFVGNLQNVYQKLSESQRKKVDELLEEAARAIVAWKASQTN